LLLLLLLQLLLLLLLLPAAQAAKQVYLGGSTEGQHNPEQKTRRFE
jgi:hypothetical protein